MLIKMDCINFSETKAERKYYEGKKQKALRYVQHTIEDVENDITVEEEPQIFKYYKGKLEVIYKLVNDI